MLSKRIRTDYSPGWYYTGVFLFLCYVTFVCIFSVSVFESWRFFTNKSRSMAPTIDTHSLMLVVKQPSYNVGDIISFYSLESDKVEIITHRIIRLGGNVYITKGDANEATDQTKVVPRLIIGRTVFVIPKLGSYISFVKTGAGLWFTILLPTALIICKELFEIYSEFKKSA